VVFRPWHRRLRQALGLDLIEAPTVAVQCGRSPGKQLPPAHDDIDVFGIDLETKRSEQRVNDPISNCLPMGAVRSHTWNGPRKAVQTPGLVILMSEFETSYRQIFTDGRPLPADPNPSWNGYSSGKWEGDTLVVQTNGFRDGMWLDATGNPMTDAAKITERFRRPNFGKLEIEITVDDPKAYTKPWTVKLTQSIKLDTELLDFGCTDNEKDVPHLSSK
jgi:hypothetical protein